MNSFTSNAHTSFYTGPQWIGDATVNWIHLYNLELSRLESKKDANTFTVKWHQNTVS